MFVLRRFASTVRNLLRRRHVERELDAELHSALDLIADEKMAAGMNDADAWRAARIELGGVEQVRTRVRETRAGAGLDRWSQDLRSAVRWMRHTPGLAAATVLILSVGIGAVTGVFAVARSVLFSPPGGIPGSDRLVAIDRLNVNRPFAPVTISYAEYLEYRQRTDLFEVAASQPCPMVVRIGDRTERIAAELATANYFDVLDVRLGRGRSFTSETTDEAIASDRFLRAFGLAGDGLGTVIHVFGQPFTIVGIAPDVFMGTEQLDRSADLWLPAAARRRLNPSLSPERAKPVTDLADRSWTAVGRLRDGIDILAAEAALRVTARDLERRHPEALRGITVALRPGLLLRSRERLQAGMTFGLILAAVFLLLLIACANVANLTLARTLGRSKEIAIRLALGASRRRVVRQLLTETVLLTAIASVGGLVLARWMLTALGRVMPPEAELLLLARVTVADWRVVLFLFVVTSIVALAAGLVPAWQGTNVALISAMKQGGPSGPKARRTRVVFVTVQVALAVVLLSGSGLLVRALQAAYAVRPGFETEGLVLASVDLPPADHAAGHSDLVIRMQAELAQHPDLLRASVAGQAPLQDGGPLVGSFTRVPPPKDGDTDAGARVLSNHVGPGYFETLGLPIRAGRGFGAQDMFGAEPVVIVNEALANARWPNENPVGTLLRLGHERTPRTVVGVVAQAQHIGFAGKYAEGLYLPLAQVSIGWPGWTVLLRARGDLPSATRAAQRALDAVGPNLPLYDARPMDEHIAALVFAERIMAIVTGTFGLLALLLTAAGLAASVSFVVAQRTHEIGIRMALGAPRPQVIALLMRQGLTVTAVGAAIGLALSAVGAVVLKSLFVDFRVMDPVVPLVVCALLGVVALTAGILPARRAARVDPLAALRAE